MRRAPSSGQPASGKVGLAVRSAKRPAGNHSVLYTRLPRLIEELDLARADGRLASQMKSIAAVDLLILDDWSLQAIDANARYYLLEILEDR